MMTNKYDLVANIVHDGEPNKGTFRVHIFHKANSQWYEMQDLHVTEILPQMITLTESYIQIYERISRKEEGEREEAGQEESSSIPPQ